MKSFYRRICSLLITSGLVFGHCAQTPDGPQPEPGPNPAALALKQMTPYRGPSTGSVSVTLYGEAFSPQAKVFIHGTSAPLEQWVSSQEIRVTLPAHVGTRGLVDVRVENPDGKQVSRSDLFSYYYGDLSFSGQEVFAMLRCISVAFADFNEDHKADLLCGTYNTSAMIHLAFGNGDGTFQAPQGISLNGGPALPASLATHISVGDVDGNGHTDIVTTNTGSNNISILAGHGDGTFETPQVLSVGLVPQATALGDVNGDGKLDIVVANANSATVTLLLNNSLSAFVSSAYMAGNTPVDVALADVNQDGRLDLIVALQGSKKIGVSFGTGMGTFLAQTEVDLEVAPRRLAVVDVNKDGHVDLVALGTFESGVQTVLNHGDGKFLESRITLTTGTPTAFVVGDFNQDEYADVMLVASTDNTARLLLGKGDGTFDASQTIGATGASSGGIAAADLNADGKLDFVAANIMSNNVGIFLNHVQ